MGKEYTLDQVKEHNKPTDLWIVIDNNVYDVTKYVKEHPGGEKALMSVAGKDGSKAFNGPHHTDKARTLLKKFLIGSVKK